LKKRPCARTGSSGQSIVEFALVLPLVVLIVLGVVELGYALLDEHVVTRLSREGSNMISRDTSLQDAGTALTSMAAPPVNFTTGSTVIFSVLEVAATTGTANYGKLILYERYQFGAFPGPIQSQVTTAGAGSFGGAPNYQAANSDSDSSLQVTTASLPASLVPLGGLLYVTEIFTTHPWITPLNNFGVVVPQTLYSIAYF
jgi:Flp pilus assembly protein TadG